jgi:tRNA threonylcarbamoyladenosine biosynthesis protein TsaE
VNYYAKSLEETQKIARDFAKTLQKGSIVAFFGDLGAGKTTFIRSLVSARACDEAFVNSPTFQYLNIYPASPPIYHFDLYRLQGVDDFLSLGFEEYLEDTNICCIEWAERIDTLLPKKTTCVRIQHVDETTRKIEIRGYENHCVE